MTDWNMIGSMATQAVSAYGDYSTSKIQYRMDQAAREHKKIMGALSSAQQQNALTTAEVQTRDAGIRALRSIELQSLHTKSEATVNAAAAGVTGNSVDSSLQNLRRSALNANAARKASLISKFQGIEQERKNVRLSQIYGRDVSVSIPPNPTTALLGLGKSMLETWDQNQPEGMKLSDRLNTATDTLFKRK